MTATGSPSHVGSTARHGHVPLCRAGGTATPGFSPSLSPTFSIRLANAGGTDTESYERVRVRSVEQILTDNRER